MGIRRWPQDEAVGTALASAIGLAVLLIGGLAMWQVDSKSFIPFVLFMLAIADALLLVWSIGRAARSAKTRVGIVALLLLGAYLLSPVGPQGHTSLEAWANSWGHRDPFLLGTTTGIAGLVDGLIVLVPAVAIAYFLALIPATVLWYVAHWYSRGPGERWPAVDEVFGPRHS